MGGESGLTTEKQAVKAIADAIIKASKIITENNNKSYVDNQVKNHSAGTVINSEGGGSISGTIPASHVTGLYNTVAGYIIGASSSQDPVALRIIDSLNNIADSRLRQTTFNASQISDLKTGIANVVHLATDTATITDADIQKLKTDIATVGLANIGSANIGYAQVKDLTTNTAIIREGVGSKLYIDRLAVTDANIVSLTAGEIMLKNSQGQFVRITVDSQGVVGSEVVTFAGDDVLNNGSVSGGKVRDNSLLAGKIVESSITTRELNVNSIFADSAIVRQLIAQNIDTEALFANTGYINELHSNIISSANDLDLSGNQSAIELMEDSINLVVETDESTGKLMLTDKVLSATANSINLIADDIDLSANSSIDIRVNDVLEEKIYHRMDIVSTSDILSNAVTSTVLSAIVYKGTENITSSSLAANYRWKRKSSDTAEDLIWNASQNHIGVKTVTVGVGDVPYSATFECEYSDNENVVASATKGILDMSDGAVLNATIATNSPLIQSYDINTSTYTPNWSTSNVVLTPVVIMNGSQIENTDSNLTITWKRKDGSSAETNLISGETVQNNILTISANNLSLANSGMLSYIAHASYANQGGISVTADSTITFTLVKAGRDAVTKSVKIQGEQVFKYAQGSSIPSPETIRLEAETQNCTVTGWYYKSSNGIWIEYSNNLDNNTASINERYIHDQDPVFNNNVATIKVTTSEQNVYDIFSLYKVYDGERGQPGEKGEDGYGYTVFLTNENITFAGNKEGKVSATSINCNVIAYEGATKVTPVIGNVSGAPSGMIVDVLSASNNEIPIRIQIANNSTLGGAGEQFGALTVPITSPVATNLSITWSKVNTGADGEKGDSSIVFSLYAPYGDMFSNGQGDLTIVAVGYDGTEEITGDNADHVWQKYVSGTWQTITGETTDRLIVNGSTVDGIASYKCIMTYPVGNGNEYSDVITLSDKTDNYQAVIESTGGTIFKNGIGETTLKCRIFQNAKEVDASGVRYTCYWYKYDKDGNSEYWNQYDASGNIVGEPVARKSGKTITVIDKDISIKNTIVCEVIDSIAQSESDRLKTSALITIVDLNDPVMSGEEPENPEIDMLWIDTSSYPNELKRWNGAEWVSVSNVDPEALATRFTLLETSISEQEGQIALMATKEEVTEIDGRVTSAQTQLAELDVKYDNISLIVTEKNTNYRQIEQPTNPNAGDIWVRPINTGEYAGTEKQYQAIGAVGVNMPIFAYTDDGDLVYTYSDSATDTFDILIDEDGELTIQADGYYEISESDGEFIGQAAWKEIKGYDIAVLSVEVDGITSAVSNLSGDVSAVSQKADRIDWVVASGSTSISNMSMTSQALSAIANDIDLQANDTVRIQSANQISIEAVNDLNLSSNGTITSVTGNIDRSIERVETNTNKELSDINESINSLGTQISQTNDAIEACVQQDDLQTYLRYSVQGGIGTAELGQSDSKYLARISSDNGFQILYDGAVLSQMQKNTTYSPILRAGRIVQIGDNTIKLSADGGLIFN